MKTSNVILLAVVTAAALGVWAWTSRGPAVSDDVMVANALGYLIKTEPTGMFTGANRGAGTENPIVPYTSPDEVTAAYPDCCSFAYRAADGYLPPVFYRLMNDYAGIVTIQAGWKVEYPDGVKHVPFGEPVEITMTRQGKPVDTLPLK